MENKDKKIIGYRFKPEYQIEAVRNAIDGERTCFMNINKEFNFNFSISSDRYYHIKSLGTLDIWCESVYEQQEKVISMNGQFDLIVKDNKVFHKNEDITKYVKEIIRLYKNLLNSSCTTIPVTGYALRIDFDNIKFLKTGCEEKLTYLKDWLNVAKEAKLI